MTEIEPPMKAILRAAFNAGVEWSLYQEGVPGPVEPDVEQYLAAVFALGGLAPVLTGEVEPLVDQVAVSRPNIDGSTRLLLWCPGCADLHQIYYVGENGVVPEVCWEFDGNFAAPTISPSLSVGWTNGRTGEENVCHSFIRSGQWEYLSDSTHLLAGQTVPLGPLPLWVIDGD